jgi:hypothetical protein
LYIACDGPRDENETGTIEEVRNYILSSIDWNCEVKTLFREKNLSCGPAVKQAIDWFFEQEEMGIILEDDVVPAQSFFPYCEELLLRYKDDSRIGMISGNNHVGFPPIPDSYIFSKFKWTWGWATWRRAWEKMDFDLLALQSDYRESIIRNMGYNRLCYTYWLNVIESIRQHRVNTWDYQWFISLGTQNQLCIFPCVNLVSNIGFGIDATHCFGETPERFLYRDEIKFPLFHPLYILPNYEFEKIFQSVMLPGFSKLKKIIPRNIKKLIKFILRIPCL